MKFMIIIGIFGLILFSCDSATTSVERDDTYDCWVYDATTNAIMKISHDDGTILETIYGFKDVVDMKVAPVSEELWVIDAGDRALIKIRNDGVIRKKIYGFTNPRRFEIVPQTENMWVLDGDELVKVSPDGEFLKRLSGFDEIRDFDLAYTYNNNLWVAEPQRVVYINEDGEEQYSYEGSDEGMLEDVVDIKTERDSQTCWIVDHHADNDMDRVLRRDNIILISAEQEGEIRHDYAEEKYDDISKIVYNFADFSLWAIMKYRESYEDEGSPRVVRLDTAGEVVWEIDTFVNPVSIDVDRSVSRLFGWIGDSGGGRIYQVYSFNSINLTIQGISAPKILAVINKDY
jgi:hypothetical protein